MQNLFWFLHKKIHLCYCLSFSGKIKIFGCKFIPICQVYVKKRSQISYMGLEEFCTGSFCGNFSISPGNFDVTGHRVLFPPTCYHLYLLAI